MSIFTRQMLASAASSPHGLTSGSMEDPARSSWGQVHELARRMAMGLASSGVGRNGSVAVLATDAADVAPLAQAIWLRGAALTMLQQPTRRADLAVWLGDTVRAIRLIEADLVVVGEPFLLVLDQLVAQGVAVCTVESLCGTAPVEVVDADADADETDIAMRQLTSGSTGVPKAVEISHGNLAANSIALRDALVVEPDVDVMASWLPLSHDMGLVAFLIFPMQLGVQAVVITPEQFLRRPIVWAEMISRHGATLTSGPNFAYSILARSLRGTQSTDIDLSSLRVAVNGAEPIDWRDVAAFNTAGARFGLRPSALTPAYGLAEATLIVSCAETHDEATVDPISRKALAEAHNAQPVAGESEDVQYVVCLGPPVTGMEVRIRREGIPQGPRQIGAIELRGQAVAGRYRTLKGFAAIAGEDGWFDSGDLGYLDEEGRLYVCGRTKDLIVVAGRNVYPHDIERAAGNVGEVRKGCVIAIRVDAEQEGFAVLAEVRDADEEADRARISREITAQVSRAVGHPPREVRLFPAGTLPKTPSGKLRRDAARELLT